MLSGIKVVESARTLIEEIAKNRSKVKVAFFKVCDEKVIDVESKLNVYNDFCLDDIIEKIRLSPDCPYWILFMSTILTCSCRIIQHPIIIAWCPENCSVKKKMHFSSSKGAVEKFAEGCCRVEISCMEDINPCRIIEDRKMSLKLKGEVPREFCHQSI